MSYPIEAPGNHAPAAETRGFVYNHTMIRVKDPAASLDFYTRILGMHLVRKSDYEGGKFSLYFLCHLGEGETPPADDIERKQWIARRPGILELTHNWGSEADPAFAYHNGNQEPRGFGHLCISVPDFAAAIAFFDREGVTYQKRPEDGSMKDIAFIKDPDGYWIEIIGY
ncbi:MAG: lactoylglutathione lyase [Cardiobacteriaceae bacterium]|nr:lactoylglutathione lyase [Cardiobacteriaceae bacterium]